MYCVRWKYCIRYSYIVVVDFTRERQTHSLCIFHGMYMAGGYCILLRLTRKVMYVVSFHRACRNASWSCELRWGCFAGAKLFYSMLIVSPQQWRQFTTAKQSYDAVVLHGGGGMAERYMEGYFRTYFSMYAHIITPGRFTFLIYLNVREVGSCVIYIYICFTTVSLWLCWCNSSVTRQISYILMHRSFHLNFTLWENFYYWFDGKLCFLRNFYLILN